MACRASRRARDQMACHALRRPRDQMACRASQRARAYCRRVGHGEEHWPDHDWLAVGLTALIILRPEAVTFQRQLAVLQGWVFPRTESFLFLPIGYKVS